MWGLRCPALGCCSLRNYWKISNNCFLLFCLSSSVKADFFSLKLFHQSKKQQQLIMKSWYEIQFILRSEEAKASLPVKKKTNRQLEAGRVTIQCVRLNDDDFWQSQNRFCFVVKICCHQENDSYYSVIQPRRSGSSGKTCLHRTHVHEVLLCFLFFYNQLWYGPNSLAGHASQELH